MHFNQRNMHKYKLNLLKFTSSIDNISRFCPTMLLKLKAVVALGGRFKDPNWYRRIQQGLGYNVGAKSIPAIALRTVPVPTFL